MRRHSEKRSLSRYLSAFRDVALRGSAATISSCSGNLCAESPCPRRDFPPIQGGCAGGCSTTAQRRSPRALSGSPVIATSPTAGCSYSSCSISPAEMFSPLRFLLSAGHHEVSLCGEVALVGEPFTAPRYPLRTASPRSRISPSAPVGSGVPRPSVTRGSPWRPGACPRWWPGHAAAPGGRRSSPRRPLFRGRRRAVRPRRTAALLTAAQQLGSAVATTEMAVGYAREREQFGTADRRLPGRKTPVRTDAGSGLNGSERGVCRRPDGSGE